MLDASAFAAKRPKQGSSDKSFSVTNGDFCCIIQTWTEAHESSCGFLWFLLRYSVGTHYLDRKDALAGQGRQ